MSAWWKKKTQPTDPGTAEEQIRKKYGDFQKLLHLNNECLELLTGLQEDLQYMPPMRDVVGDRIDLIHQKAKEMVRTLIELTDGRYSSLLAAVDSQFQEAGSYISARQELSTPRLSVWMSEVDSGHGSEIGGKAAALAEIKSKLGLPVPDGYVLTTEAYYRFCGIPLWTAIRDNIRSIDLKDLKGLQQVSERLMRMVTQAPVPRIVEVAITERARTLCKDGTGLAVRSSAVGEGGEQSFAGQFHSIINVPPEKALEAYKGVVASRFSTRALSYRISMGILEVESPLAVLFLPVIRARSSGIMYTRNPEDPGSKALWITATRGLGLDIASGRMPADLFVVSRERSHIVMERRVVAKHQELVPREGGGIFERAIAPGNSEAPSLGTEDLHILADWGTRIEQHFKCPQDVEWAVDDNGQVWILQSRPLVLAERSRTKLRVKGEPLLSGGRTVFPGRISGRAHVARKLEEVRDAPDGSILFLPRASPEIVEVLPSIVGLAAEWGNLAGHAAALLREFKIASVFGLTGISDKVKTGDMVSLDAVEGGVFPGNLWPRPPADVPIVERHRQKTEDPISRRLLALNLVDPSSISFRPGGCKSTHDVLRFCHEKGIEAMFATNDSELGRGYRSPRKLLTPVPVNLYVMDLGGGLALDHPDAPEVRPDQIVSKPFQGLWKGVSHPGVSWTRKMPAGLGDLATVMAQSLSSSGASRALGEKSYLLVAEEYMNLNSRLAYHFTLVDACLSAVPAQNYIAFRFAGGGSIRQRRSLRACFIEACLSHYGFVVDRRGDLVNAWLKKAPADQTEMCLDILGRLMACSSQLDMYMTSHSVMQWYVDQFLAGNYGFVATEDAGEKS